MRETDALRPATRDDKGPQRARRWRSALVKGPGKTALEGIQKPCFSASCSAIKPKLTHAAVVGALPDEVSVAAARAAVIGVAAIAAAAAPAKEIDAAAALRYCKYCEWCWR